MTNPQQDKDVGQKIRLDMPDILIFLLYPPENDMLYSLVIV